MGSPCDLLVVGLGNPGDRYEHTRHNVGADAAAILAKRHDGAMSLEKQLKARVSEFRLDGRRVVVAVPTTWMNESGQCVSALVRRYGIEDWSALVILHDELDLPEARVKVKQGGGLAGHNGLRSITAHLHTQDYSRVRIGVGKPPGGPDQGADWVLSKVPKAQRELLDAACEKAADATVMILDQGIDAAMQQVNASN
ncbi:MAG: aminoacyl-tRNA hydrolase [Actinobacteria bacterium]|uniref:peptidyl-tRNA hydrolase n=1 Tax=freshwater metagenome TaxID=449393 RepID=A0A6J6SAW1_9ZZZZ|nr:aminoacyl-tRNA hydrolase [Actinomycetota bacterium]